eukprot:13292902-Ditylum_brightwellii.AAC.1
MVPSSQLTAIVHITISSDPCPQDHPQSYLCNSKIVLYNPDSCYICLFHYKVQDALSLQKAFCIFGYPALFQAEVNFAIHCPPLHFTCTGLFRPGAPLFPTTGGGIDNYEKMGINLVSQKKFSDNNQGKTTITI